MSSYDLRSKFCELLAAQPNAKELEKGAMWALVRLMPSIEHQERMIKLYEGHASELCAILKIEVPTNGHS